MVHTSNSTPDNVFITIFTMTFGAMAAGNSQSYSPDFGKAS